MRHPVYRNVSENYTTVIMEAVATNRGNIFKYKFNKLGLKKTWMCDFNIANKKF